MEDVLNSVMRELSTVKSHCQRLESNYETVLAENKSLTADHRIVLYKISQITSPFKMISDIITELTRVPISKGAVISIIQHVCDSMKPQFNRIAV